MKNHSYFDLIRIPIITEKATSLTDTGNKFVFEVQKISNKNRIKYAVEKLFSVKVKKVNIINVKGKMKKFKGVIGKQVDIKKAIVTLEYGNTIDLSGGYK